MIRRAEVADAREIGELHLRAWWWAYRELLDHALLAEHDPDEREAVWTARLSEGADAWVRVQDDRIAGFVLLDPPEVRALHVDPSAQGAGVGSDLLGFAEQRLAAAGTEQAALWCLREDGLARAFSEARGWRLSEGERESAWGPEVRYVKDVTSA